MKNEITITRMIEGTKKLREEGKKFTHIGVGPMSHNLLRAALELANEKRFPLILIASRNQVDSDRLGGGYVCGFDQERFVKTTGEIADSIGFDGLCYFCRDHGGPWQRDKERNDKLLVEEAMQIGLESYFDDIRAGFDLLHIDPTKDPYCGSVVPLNLVLERTITLIEQIEKARRENGWKEIAYEVGTEETMGGLIDPKAFEDFICSLKKELEARGLPMPLFVVGQTGTLTRLTSNVGHYDTPTAQKLSDITHKYGTGLKEHNGDYLSNAILLEHPVIGLDAMNVAPEFGLVETEALLELAKIEEKFTAKEKQSNICATLSLHAVRSERWRKWMVGDKRSADVQEIMKNQEDVDLITTMCGHYTLEDKEVKTAVSKLNRNISALGLDPERYVIKKIKDSIDRYIYCFNLYGTTDEILARVK